MSERQRTRGIDFDLRKVYYEEILMQQRGDSFDERVSSLLKVKHYLTVNSLAGLVFWQTEVVADAGKIVCQQSVKIGVEVRTVVCVFQKFVQPVHAGGDARLKFFRRRQRNPARSLDFFTFHKALSIRIDQHVYAAVKAHIHVVRNEGL